MPLAYLTSRHRSSTNNSHLYLQRTGHFG